METVMTGSPSLVLNFRFNIDIKLYSQVKQGLQRESLEGASGKHTKFTILPVWFCLGGLCPGEPWR